MADAQQLDAPSLTRRSLLTRGAGAGGALALAATPALASQERLRVFRLEPEWNGAAYCNVNEQSKPNSCHGCKACHRHGRNKLFRSEGSANRGRAHAGCRCKVKRAGKLPRETWVKLFGKPRDPRRDSVDRRDPKVRDILSG